MGFNLSKFFRGDDDNKIVSVEEDKDVDYLDTIAEDFFGSKEDKKKSGGDDNSADSKIKAVIEASGLTREKAYESHPKMKAASGSAQRMIESVLEMMTEEEKKDKHPEVLIKVLGTKLSSESLAKIVSAMIILIEENRLNEILGLSESVGDLEEKLRSAGIESRSVD